MLAAAPLMTALHVADEAHLGPDLVDRMFTLALLQECGVQVIVDGTHAAPWEERDEAARQAYLKGRSAVRLHAMLRAHDRGPVLDPSRSQAAAYEIAARVRDYAVESSLRLAALQINEEAVHTRSGRGQWWPSSVRELLQRGPR